MVYGIDINSSQASINIGTVKTAGNDFVIVKMGGANVPIYVAPYYTSQIDRCIAANMPKGHYWVVGDFDGSNPSVTTQADYFTSHLHKFDKTKDILGIDNEVFSGENTYFWPDAYIATFIDRVKANLGIDPTQFWVYASRSVWTSGSLGPWTKTIATGCRFWVADWGSNDGVRVNPNLGGFIPTVDVQQYWDKYPVAGYAVDRNYSSRSISELFGSWSSSSGGGGGGGTGSQTGNVLSDQDRVDVQGYMDNSMTSHISEMSTATWQHLMASAIDKGNHYIQTYAAWSQRDLEKILAFVSGDDPTEILAKETSSNIVYALNPQKGTKRALTAGQINVLNACGLDYKVVADGSLAAFTTVTG